MQVQRSLPFVFLLVVSAVTLSACSEQVSAPEEVVRSIRTITVSEPASGMLRRFSGVVEPSATSSLSFEVPGNVKEVLAEAGESITKGQVLARLDERRFALNLEAAQANVGRAQVELDDAQRELERLEQVADRDASFVSAQALDQARANLDAAHKNLGYVTSRLNLAKRDLERTEMRAPFDGVVTERRVDPFQEVERGERLFDIHAEGAMEAAISVPESEIDRIYLGMPGAIRYPAMPEVSNAGVVTEISQAAGTTNAFPIRLGIQDSGPQVRPGLTAEVSLTLGGEDGDLSYLVPIGALIPRGDKGGEGFVFVYDQNSSTVVTTAIEHDGIRDNNLVVTRGLTAGDVVAVAGVSFLRDGQTVRLMQP